MKPLKIIYLLVGLLLAFSPVFSQKKEIKVVQTERVIGKNLITGSEIKAMELLFPERIHETFFDTTTNLLTVQLRGLDAWDGAIPKKKGNIIQFDFINKKILWTKKIDYEINELLKFDDLLILNEYNDGYGLDPYTGTTLWTVKNYIYFANPEYKVGVAYSFNEVEGTYTNDLYGINLWKGNPIWKRNISRKYGWNDYFYLNDSTLFIVASGLHTININTGEGWDYNTITGINPFSNPEEKKKEARKAVEGAIIGVIAGAMVAGIIGGLLGGSFNIYMPMYTNYSALIPEEDITKDIVSNTLIDNNFIYFASKEQLVKIEKESGNIIWKYTFSEYIASNSSIFMGENTLYMINNGFAFKGSEQISYGKPFIASFNIQTGKQEYLKFIDDSEFIRSFRVSGDLVYLVFTDKIVVFNLKTGNLISENFFKPKLTSNLNCFAGDHIFVNAGSNSLIPLWKSDSTKLYVFNENDHLLTINYEFNVAGAIAKRNIWTYFLGTESYSLFFNNFSEGRKTIITNTLGEKIAELDVSPSAFIFNDMLFDKRDKSFIAIDLKQIP